MTPDNNGRSNLRLRVVRPLSCLRGLLVLLPAAAIAVQGVPAKAPPSGPSAGATVTDIEYGQALGERLLLDAHVPDGPGPYPVAILVHGGGWSAGDKAGTDKPGSSADITPWFGPLSKAGFTWFSINYRLAPRHRWPAALDDVQTAIRWVKAHAPEFKGDPLRIALVGHSAGGHLATLAATVADESVRVQAVVGYAPVTNHEQDLPVRGGLSPSLQGLLNRPREVTEESRGLLRAISPLNHVRPGLPPFLLLHGDADQSVPLQQSLDFQTRLRENGVRCDLIVAKGAPHRLTDWNQFMPDHGARMVAWLNEVLGSPVAAKEVASVRWGRDILNRSTSWYSSAAARAIADSVLRYQSPQGAWPKNLDLAVPPAAPEDIPQPGSERANTIDNDATTLPMRFLARLVEPGGDGRYQKAFERGFDYLLASQYPNGGFPQFYPLREGYYSHVTFNDDAMVNVLVVLRDVAAGRSPYAFVDAVRRALARESVARGIAIILSTQLKEGGRLTAWCAQYDERTLEPAWARKYEPPSLSGRESVGIVRFLMEIEQPSPEIAAAIDAAVAWFQAVAIHGVRLEGFTAPDGKKDRRVVEDKAAAPIWARFYDLHTNQPMFLGRDSVVHRTLAEIEYERRNGYAYYGDWPARLIETEYPRWRAKQRLP